MPDDAIRVLEYSDEHQRQVLELILAIQRQEFGLPITAADQPDLLNIPTFYQKDKGNFWVALHDERVVGTIALLDIGDSMAALRKMFVDAAYRGPRTLAAHQLMAALLQWATQGELLTIYLGTTDRYLAAHRFYEKSGFRRIPKSELPPAFPVMSVDTVFYCRQLPSAADQQA